MALREELEALMAEFRTRGNAREQPNDSDLEKVKELISQAQTHVEEKLVAEMEADPNIPPEMKEKLRQATKEKNVDAMIDLLVDQLTAVATEAMALSKNGASKKEALEKADMLRSMIEETFDSGIAGVHAPTGLEVMVRAIKKSDNTAGALILAAFWSAAVRNNLRLVVEKLPPALKEKFKAILETS